MRSTAKFLIVLLSSARVIAVAQSDVAAMLRQGARLVEQNQLSAAQEFYEKALQNSPRNPDLLFELGMVYFREHNWPQATESYKASLRNGHEQIKALFYLAQSYFMQSDLTRAQEAIGQAAILAPNDPQVCQKYGEYLGAAIETREQALPWLEKARRLNPEMAEIDFQIGMTEFELTDYESAASSFETALNKNSDDAKAAFYLADSSANLGQWERARKFYDYSLAHGYANAAGYYGLGRSQVELGEYEGAVKNLQRAIGLQPSVIKAHFQLAKAYRQLGKIEEAERENKLFEAMSDRVDTASAMKTPEDEDAWKRVKPLLESGKEPEALQLLATLPAAAGRESEPYYRLGTMYYSLGRTADARRVVAIARMNDPKSARIAAYLGMLQLALGEASAAENSFTSALALDSMEPLGLIGMGGIRYQQQRWAEAISYLERSRTADPQALYLLCDAYYRVGRPEQAALTGEVIRALGSDQKQVLDELEKLIEKHQNDGSAVAR